MELTEQMIQSMKGFAVDSIGSGAVSRERQDRLAKTVLILVSEIKATPSTLGAEREALVGWFRGRFSIDGYKAVINADALLSSGIVSKLPTREGVAYAIADSRWKSLYGGKIQPMWFVVEAGGTDGSLEANHLLAAYHDADAVLALRASGTGKGGEG